MADRPKLIVTWSMHASGSQQSGLIAFSGWAGVIVNSLFQVDIEATPIDGSWVAKFRNRSSGLIAGNLSIVLAGDGTFSSPCRLVSTTGEQQAREISKDGGIVLGHRIDSAFPGAPIRDSIAIEMPGESLMVWTAKVEPCSPADFNGDGSVDSRDQAILLGSWGTTDLIPDIDRNGIVDANDLSLFAGYWSG